MRKMQLLLKGSLLFEAGVAVPYFAQRLPPDTGFCRPHTKIQWYFFIFSGTEKNECKGE